MGNPSIPCKNLSLISLKTFDLVKQYKDDPNKLGPGIYNPKSEIVMKKNRIVKIVNPVQKKIRKKDFMDGFSNKAIQLLNDISVAPLVCIKLFK